MFKYGRKLENDKSTQYFDKTNVVTLDFETRS